MSEILCWTLKMFFCFLINIRFFIKRIPYIGYIYRVFEVFLVYPVGQEKRPKPLSNSEMAELLDHLPAINLRSKRVLISQQRREIITTIEILVLVGLIFKFYLI
jgi:hypothetical protein